MEQRFDVAVLGLGGMGSQALYHLSRSHVRAIGIDQFRPPHSRGSSHGLSRLIRLAYFEQPQYVPLLLRAYRLWAELQQACDETLYIECGLLEGGPPESPLVQGLQQAASEYHLDLPQLSADMTHRRFPGFALPSDWELFFESQAGFLRPERCIHAALELARNNGAEFRTETRIEAIESRDRDVRVVTSGGVIMADKLILTLGPWSPLWHSHVDFPIRLLHKTLMWFETPSRSHQVKGGCPCFLFDADGGYFYGMPAEQDVGLKVAKHDGGYPIESVDQSVDASSEIASVQQFAQRYFHPALNQVAQIVECRYSMSPDEHFVLGTSPQDERILFLAGLSGHGFKFASVLGSVMSEWAITGSLNEEACFLHRKRFGDR